MVHLIRKSALPAPCAIPGCLRETAKQALTFSLREPRPQGFPLLFTADMRLIEPAVAFLHEHAVLRAHSTDTVRTYAEILYDWFETLEQNEISWKDADATDLVAYRNRMMREASAHTERPYCVSTINHRVRGVLRFYEWAVRMRWLTTSPLCGRHNNFNVTKRIAPNRKGTLESVERSLFVLRQFEPLPRPFSPEQVRELLAKLPPPYDLMARWQLYTGLRVSELLRLKRNEVAGLDTSSFKIIEVLRKGRKDGYVIAPASLLDETLGYIESYRHAWLERARRAGRASDYSELFINSRGSRASKNAYQRVIQKSGLASGIRATTHLLRATFACMLLARLEQMASGGVAINPLLIVKVLMGHERIETTDRYLRAIVVDADSIKQALDGLFPEGE
ncbi:tyrosine-type recombinase/integrase [Collimonas pratensis]|uniref:Phage integrase family protein n=1 Tax=Collimonas pratensis TaxID=279113 RepID=A0A127Q7W0_9BURK|nr:tyrosine-type recombinase/integrase [Collimonas pratensis]AMP06138.1 phage integrase family protein [Collimonas pratensis]